VGEQLQAADAVARVKSTPAVWDAGFCALKLLISRSCQQEHMSPSAYIRCMYGMSCATAMSVSKSAVHMLAMMSWLRMLSSQCKNLKIMRFAYIMSS
jgi:hypothetical protein